MKKFLFTLICVAIFVPTINTLADNGHIDWIIIHRTLNGSVQQESIDPSQSGTPEIFMDEGGYLAVEIWQSGGSPNFNYGIWALTGSYYDDINKAGNSHTFYPSNEGYRGNTYDIWVDSDIFEFIITEQSAGLDCDPDIELIQINGTTVNINGGTIDVELESLNNTFEVMLKGDNDGSDDTPDGINNLTLAFPQYTSNADKGLITTGSNTYSDLTVNSYFGDAAMGGDGYANYVFVEGIDQNGWNSNESNEIYLNVKPKNWGDFYIEFRMGLPTDNSWDNLVHDPSGGYCPSCNENDNDIDPVKFHCYYIKVNVIQEQQVGLAEFFVYDGDIGDDPASDAFIACYGPNNNTYTGVTDNNGYYQFTLPVEHYYYDVYNQELDNGEREIWASSQFDVSATQQVSEQVEREYPRVTDLYAMSTNGNFYYEPGDVLYVNTDYHMKIPVFNNSTWQNTNTRVKLILDQDQELPYDVVSEFSAEEVINLGQSNTFTIPFNLTSSLNGTILYMKVICESELNVDDWRLTDLINWEESFNVNSSDGSIEVYVKDKDNVAVESGEIVTRSNIDDYTYIDEKITNSSGYAYWSDIDAATYKFAAYVNDNSPIWEDDCYWGDIEGTVSAGTTSTAEITQFEPFVETISVSGSSFLPGEIVHVDVTVQNNTSISQSVKTEILIDFDQASPWDHPSTQHGPVTIAANGIGDFGFDWQIPTDASLGTYHIAARTYRHFEYGDTYSPTDATGWDGSFVVVETITGLAEFLIYDGDIGAEYAQGAYIACYGPNNNTYTGVTDNNGYYQFILPVEHYYYDVYNQELDNGEREIWASSQFDVSATQQVSEQVEREYPRVTDLYAMSANGNFYFEPGDVLYVNTDYHMKIPVFNNSTWQNTNTRVKLILDQDQELPYDVVSEFSAEEVINLGQSNTFTIPFNLTSSLNGTILYMKVICESELNVDDWRLTDLINWEESFNVEGGGNYTQQWTDIAGNENDYLIKVNLQSNINISGELLTDYCMTDDIVDIGVFSTINDEEVLVDEMAEALSILALGANKVVLNSIQYNPDRNSSIPITNIQTMLLNLYDNDNNHYAINSLIELNDADQRKIRNTSYFNTEGTDYYENRYEMYCEVVRSIVYFLDDEQILSYYGNYSHLLNQIDNVLAITDFTVAEPLSGIAGIMEDNMKLMTDQQIINSNNSILNINALDNFMSKVGIVTNIINSASTISHNRKKALLEYMFMTEITGQKIEALYEAISQSTGALNDIALVNAIKDVRYDYYDKYNAYANGDWQLLANHIASDMEEADWRIIGRSRKTCVKRAGANAQSGCSHARAA